jgi:hypothetical protein
MHDTVACVNCPLSAYLNHACPCPRSNHPHTFRKTGPAKVNIRAHRSLRQPTCSVGLAGNGAHSLAQTLASRDPAPKQGAAVIACRGPPSSWIPRLPLPRSPITNKLLLTTSTSNRAQTTHIQPNDAGPSRPATPMIRTHIMNACVIHRPRPRTSLIWAALPGP